MEAVRFIVKQSGRGALEYKEVETLSTKECCNLWLEVWEHLKKRFTPDMKSIEDAESAFSGMQSFLKLVIYVALKEAKNLGIESVMTGDGADELFAGYSYMHELSPGTLNKSVS